MKPLGYVYIGLGYVVAFGGMYLSNLTHAGVRPEYDLLVVANVLGAFFVFAGTFMFKQARRYQIVADFLNWRAEYRNQIGRARSKSRQP